MKKGTKIRVTTRHAGLAGSTGRIVRVERIGGQQYYLVRMTGGRGAGLAARLAPSELEAGKGLRPWTD